MRTGIAFFSCALGKKRRVLREEAIEDVLEYG